MRRSSPAVVRHLAAHRLGYAAVAVTVLFTTACTAAVTSFASTVAGTAVRRSLTGNSSAVISVTAPASAAAAGRDATVIAGTISKSLGGLPVRLTASLRSQYLDLPPGPGGKHAQTQVITLPGLAGHAGLVHGRWPRQAAADPVSVCIGAQPARSTGLAVGDVLTLRDSVGGPPVTVRVACVYQPVQPTSSYWSLSPVGSSGTADTGGFRIYGPLIANPAAAARLPVGSASWLAVPAFGQLRSAALGALSNRVSAATSTLTNAAALQGAAVSTGLPALLATLSTSLLVARSQLLIGVLILLVIAGAALAATVRLLSQQLEGEAALLAARGASRRQLAAQGAARAGLIAAAAVILGPLLASRLVPVLGRTGALAAARLQLSPSLTGTAWLASAAVAIGCGLIITVPWLRPLASPGQQRARTGRERALAGAASAGADLALIVLAGLAGWQLARYHAPVSTGLAGTLGVDPILVTAPVLALAAGTVILLRLLPPAARLADRGAARGRGLSVAVASWQLSRRPLRQAGPGLLAVLAVATAVIALAEHSSWQHSAQDQAAFAVGADERVTLPPAAPLGLGQVAAITAAPGVTVSTPVLAEPATLAGSQQVNVLAMNARAAAGIVPLRRDLSAAPPAALLRSLAPARSPGAALPGRPDRLRVTAQLSRAPAEPARLEFQLSDAAGLSYQVLTGSLPADGRPHQLTAVLSGRQIDYPLRLTGFALNYTVPGSSARPQTVTLSVGPVQAGTARGPLAAAVPAAGPGTTGPPVTMAETAIPLDTTVAPRIESARRTSRGDVLVSFQAGVTQPGGTAILGFQGRSPASVTVTAGPRPGPLSALVTASFLAATSQRLGAVIPVIVDGANIRVALRHEISRFPTAGAGLVVDQSALQDVLRAAAAPPLPAAQWWLRTSRPAVLRGLPPGSTVLRRAAVTRALLTQPLATAPQQALLAIAVAAVLLAAAGFVVGIAASRERAHDVLLLDALGTPPALIIRLLCLEQALLAVPTAAAGLLLGALLSRLIVPAVNLTAQAAAPIPPVLVHVPWAACAAVAGVIAATPTLATALAGLRRPQAAVRLRLEAET